MPTACPSIVHEHVSPPLPSGAHVEATFCPVQSSTQSQSPWLDSEQFASQGVGPPQPCSAWASLWHAAAGLLQSMPEPCVAMQCTKAAYSAWQAGFAS